MRSADPLNARLVNFGDTYRLDTVSAEPQRPVAQIAAPFTKKVIAVAKRTREPDVECHGQTNDPGAEEHLKGGRFIIGHGYVTALPVSIRFSLTEPAEFLIAKHLNCTRNSSDHPILFSFCATTHGGLCPLTGTRIKGLGCGHRMIICNSGKFIFVHIHKAGGTSMERAIAPHLGWNDLILGSTPLGQAANQAFRDTHGLFDHASAEEIAHVCGAELFERYYSFALVRHPLDRAVSMYNFIGWLCRFVCKRQGLDHSKLAAFVLERHDHREEFNIAVERDPFLAWPITAAFLEHPSFGGFIRAPETRADRSFLPQVDMVRSLDGRVKVKDCIRLEDLPLQIGSLSRKLGLPLELERHNTTAFTMLEPRDLRSDDKDYLLHEFGEDILAFDYGA